MQRALADVSVTLLGVSFALAASWGGGGDDDDRGTRVSSLKCRHFTESKVKDLR